MSYSLVMMVHVAAVVISLSLFVLRASWVLRGEQQRMRQTWVRILPHVNDTLLLTAGIVLAVMVQQYPFVHAWLTVKVVALVVYILLGMVVLKAPLTQMQRWMVASLALAVFAFIISVALSKQALGIFA